MFSWAKNCCKNYEGRSLRFWCVFAIQWSLLNGSESKSEWLKFSLQRFEAHWGLGGNHQNIIFVFTLSTSTISKWLSFWNIQDKKNIMLSSYGVVFSKATRWTCLPFLPTTGWCCWGYIKSKFISRQENWSYEGRCLRARAWLWLCNDLQTMCKHAYLFRTFWKMPRYRFALCHDQVSVTQTNEQLHRGECWILVQSITQCMSTLKIHFSRLPDKVSGKVGRCL